MLVPLVVAIAALAGAAPASAATSSFGYTGGEQVFKVPAGVTTVHAVAVGARGGASDQPGGTGGLGAVIGADMPVTPGQLLYVKAGSNKFRFMSRLRGKRLRPGRYRLVITPTAAGRKGTPGRVRFRIVR